jgi:hypothetical protein
MPGLTAPRDQLIVKLVAFAAPSVDGPAFANNLTRPTRRGRRKGEVTAEFPVVGLARISTRAHS